MSCGKFTKVCNMQGVEGRLDRNGCILISSWEGATCSVEMYWRNRTVTVCHFTVISVLFPSPKFGYKLYGIHLNVCVTPNSVVNAWTVKAFLLIGSQGNECKCYRQHRHINRFTWSPWAVPYLVLYRGLLVKAHHMDPIKTTSEAAAHAFCTQAHVLEGRFLVIFLGLKPWEMSMP